MSDRVSRTIQKYNEIADEYAKKIVNRLPKKELDTFIRLLPKSDNYFNQIYFLYRYEEVSHSLIIHLHVRIQSE